MEERDHDSSTCYTYFKEIYIYERMIVMEIKWVSGDGGPHILMERKYLDFWTAQ